MPLNCSSNLCSGADVTILGRQMIDYASNCSSQFSPLVEEGKEKGWCETSCKLDIIIWSTDSCCTRVLGQQFNIWSNPWVQLEGVASRQWDKLVVLCFSSWDVYFAVNCLQLGFCCQWMGGNTIAVLIIFSSIAAVSWCHQPISGWLQVGRQWSAIGTKVSPVEMLGFGLFLYFVMLPRPRYSEDLQTILFSRSDFCGSVTHVTFNMFVWASWCNTNVLIIHYYLQFSLF